MLVLGLQGSPRKNGSADYLLRHVLREIEKTGAAVETLDIPRMNIRPCLGCGYCEKKGFCVIDDDDMAVSVYPLLRKAQVVIAASPVFFYSVTAQLKALIDRTQALWARKYRFHLSDPLSTSRKGVFLSMGGSRGKKLFDGIHLVATYFFDAVDAASSGSLTYPGIETPADFQNRPDLIPEISNTVQELMSPLLERKRILFLGKQDDIRTCMAVALARFQAGKKLQVVTDENEPARKTHPGVIKALADIGIDMAFPQPPLRSGSLRESPPDITVSMSEDVKLPAIPHVRTLTWNLPDPGRATFDVIVRLREQIRENITRMTTEL